MVKKWKKKREEMRCEENEEKEKHDERDKLDTFTRHN